MEELMRDAKEVFDIEIMALKTMSESIGREFEMIVEAVTACDGKVVLSGMGKSGHVARKISATMSSLGISSIFVHPGEALHGDMGTITSADVVILISYSGECREVIEMLLSLKVIGAKVIGITGNRNSELAKECDIVQVLPPIEEACFLHLAPTSSTTICMVYGDALAVVASKKLGFTKEQFAINHPSGTLGKRLLLKVRNIMLPYDDTAHVLKTASFKEVIVEMCSKSSRIAAVLDESDFLVGIITDGDIRRMIESEKLDYGIMANNICTLNPKHLEANSLAINALSIMRENNISAMPVLENGKYVGVIGFQEIMLAGLI